MVRLKAPLFSLEASGTLGKSVVFAKWKGRDYARRHAIPANPQSGLQTGVRTVFGYIAQRWASVSAANQAKWAALAAADDVTALNAQIKDAVDRARRNLGWREDPDGSAALTVDVPVGASATAQPNTLVLGWTDAGDADFDYCTAIYRNTAAIVTPDISMLVGIVDKGVVTFTDKGLTTGVTYHYRIRHMSVGGSLGVLHADFTGTPT